MEVDNIGTMARHPKHQISQNSLISDRQSQEGNNRREEINNSIFYETTSDWLPKIKGAIQGKKQGSTNRYRSKF